MSIELLISIFATLASVASLVVSIRKQRGLTLREIALRSIAYGEQVGKTPEERLSHAMFAGPRLDAGDNGRRDFTDAQIRIEIEGLLRESKKHVK